MNLQLNNNNKKEFNKQTITKICKKRDEINNEIEKLALRDKTKAKFFKLFNNYVDNAKDTTWIASGITIDRASLQKPTRNGTGWWISNKWGNEAICISNCYIYDKNPDKDFVFVAIPLLTNGKAFNAYYRKKGAQRSQNWGAIKTILFLLRISVSYYWNKAKEKLKKIGKDWWSSFVNLADSSTRTAKQREQAKKSLKLAEKEDKPIEQGLKIEYTASSFIDQLTYLELNNLIDITNEKTHKNDFVKNDPKVREKLKEYYKNKTWNDLYKLLI
ncbi:hypothetical protein [Mycoplasma yeatsii]|uniref:Uncharacterized protein n=1 Tax=Mycoplasma yeatsii TaxID=51365 RepID=B4YB28_9MOLU|nr:hypothetical protein [Mycoplasma yeatsii]ACB78186.1 hypothetical protein [Mycoplasma yeatsii]MDQ0568150.1 hypothetical protein [Mycoplasma yeatsii]